jgi:hypothetical protein
VKKSVSDEPFKNYRKRKLRGEIMVGEFVLDVAERAVSDGSISGYHPTWKETWAYYGDLIAGLEGILSRPSFDIANDISRMSALAVTEAFAKAKQPIVMGGEILSELDKTVGMFQRPFGAARRHLQNMQANKARRLNKSGSNLASAISSAWLEGRYGWQPIILDAEAIRDQFHNQWDSHGQRLVARSTKTSVTNQTRKCVDTYGAGTYSTFQYTGSATYNVEVAASAGVIYDVSDRTTVQRLQEIMGFRHQDLLTLAWEKIPYSFVADWFVNTGTWLQAVTPNPFMSVVGSWATTVTRETFTFSGSCKRLLGGSYWATGTAGSSILTREHVVRNAYPVMPHTPTLTTKPLSALHQADAAALLVKPILGMLRGFKH